jgi:uncharacterized membrane protein
MSSAGRLPRAVAPLGARRYYRWALVLPFALPLLLLLVLLPFALWTGGRPPEVLAGLAGVLSLAAIFGGVPYALVCGVLLHVMRRRPVSDYRRLSWWLPMIFAPVAALFGGLFSVLDGWQAARAHGPRAALNFAAWALVVGYFYVALTHALGGLLRRVGLIAAEPDAR